MWLFTQFVISAVGGLVVENTTNEKHQWQTVRAEISLLGSTTSGNGCLSLSSLLPIQAKTQPQSFQTIRRPAAFPKVYNLGPQKLDVLAWMPGMHVSTVVHFICISVEKAGNN